VTDMPSGLDTIAKKPDHVPDHLVFDFDMFEDPRIRDDVQLGYMSLHRDAPDIFWSPRDGGRWMATRYEDVCAIAIDTETFSSKGQTAAREEGELPLPPQTMDPPEHLRYRLLLMKFLSAKSLKQQQGFVRDLAIDLIEKLKGRNNCEFRKEIAVVLPVTVFMTIMGWDTSRLYDMVSWVPNITDGRSPEVRVTAFTRMSEFVSQVVKDRIAHPGNDPISLLLDSEVDGKKLDPQQVEQMTHLLFLAGLDTVTNAMTFSMHHLASDPALQDRLRAHPEDIPKAVEEFLRRFSFVITYRRVTKDTVYKGVFMKEGDLINCSLPGGSNDPRIVACPEKIDIDRKGAPNLAFNTGPHACVGAPLARAELRILLEEWFARMPNVSLAPGYVAPRLGGSIAKIERLDLVWDN